MPLKEVGALSEIRVLQQKEKITTIENEILQLESERENQRTLAEAKINEINSRLKQVELILIDSEIRSPIGGEDFNMKTCGKT